MTEHNFSPGLQIAARPNPTEISSAKAKESEVSSAEDSETKVSSAEALETRVSSAEALETRASELYAIEYQSVSGTTGAREQLSLLPARFTAFIYHNQGRPLKIGLMALVFITALFSKAYTGDYQLIINNQVGGILYVLFGSLAFSALFPRMKIAFPVLLATGITCLLEFVQWFRIPFMTDLTRIKAFAYLFGTSFNPRDFLYYGAGAAVALLVLWFIRED